MSHLKATLFKLLAAVSLLSAAPPTVAAADRVPDAVKAGDGLTADVWPEGEMPGRGAREPEGERPPKGDGVRRITNVSRPTLTVFPARKAGVPAPAVIIAPGGGYSYVVYDKEGTEVAAWLNSVGITALVLKYRVPNNRDS